MNPRQAPRKAKGEKIGYKIARIGKLLECLTPCPWKASIKVGSEWCHFQCGYSIKDDFEKQVVTCNFKEKKNDKKL